MTTSISLTIIVDHVEKLDTIQDDFIHYQFLRFCQTTRLQYINSHILLGNRFILEQIHVDYKIDEALLIKGTKHHLDDWDGNNKAWTHIVLHLPDTDDGFGVTFNYITKDTVFYTTTSTFVS